MTGSKRPANEWYSPYFAPTTVLIAVTVLIVSVQAGKYAGDYFVQRDKNAAATAPITNTVPAVRRAPTKAAAHAPSSKSHGSTQGKSRG